MVVYLLEDQRLLLLGRLEVGLVLIRLKEILCHLLDLLLDLHLLYRYVKDYLQVLLAEEEGRRYPLAYQDLFQDFNLLVIGKEKGSIEGG